jgi:hypothetical protein
MKRYIAVVVAAAALAAASIAPTAATAANTKAYEGITSSGNNGAFTKRAVTRSRTKTTRTFDSGKTG